MSTCKKCGVALDSKKIKEHWEVNHPDDWKRIRKVVREYIEVEQQIDAITEKKGGVE